MFRSAERNKLGIAIVMASLGFSQGCDNNTDKQQDSEAVMPYESPVALVSGVVITQQLLMAEALKKGVSLSESNLNKLLNGMIDRHAAVQKIELMELDKNPEFVAKYQQLAYKTLQKEFEVHANKLLSITPKEISNFYAENHKKFIKPPQAQLAIIELASRYGSDPDLLDNRAQSIWDELHQVDSEERRQRFAKLAEKHSTHRASRYRGGDIGYVSMVLSEQWPEELINLGLTLPVGEFSELSVNKKIYIVHVKDKRPESIASLEEATPRIKRILGAQKYTELQNYLSEKMREDLAIEVNTDNLKALVSVTEQTVSEGFSTPPLN